MSDKTKTFEEWVRFEYLKYHHVACSESQLWNWVYGDENITPKEAWSAAIESMQEEIDKRDEIILELLKSIDETCDHVTFDMYYAIGKIEKFYGIDFCKMQEIEKLNGVKDE